MTEPLYIDKYQYVAYGPPIPAASQEHVDITSVAETASALSDPVRFKILESLSAAGEEMCQCHLQPLAGVSQPTLSHHLARLVDAGLVDVERRGRWAWYSLRPDGAVGLAGWIAVTFPDA